MGEEYNWDDFDSQSNEYLQSGDYGGDSFQTDDGQSWGGNGAADYGSAFGGGEGYQPPSWEQNQPIDMGGFQQPQMDYQFNTPNQPSVGFDQFGGMQAPHEGFGFGGGLGGDVSGFLSQLFGSGGALGGKGGQGLVAGLGALMEGRQNKQQAKGMQNTVQQYQQRTSPFDVQSTGASQMGANSMRDAMQQKLAAAIQDPYSAPIVKSQVQQIQKAQAIKDAAAGRRSNSSTSDPAMMAAQAKVAQDYINSLQNPAGANINPNSQGLEALLQAQKYNTNGYASPIMSALGYNASVNTAQNNQQAQLDQLRALLQGGR